jgi:glucose-6-phosphate 1-dehydrogenase
VRVTARRRHHHQGPYDTPEGFQALASRLEGLEAHKPQANRVFFLSIPPNVFLPAAANATDQARSK